MDKEKIIRVALLEQIEDIRKILPSQYRNFKDNQVIDAFMQNKNNPMLNFGYKIIELIEKDE